MSVRISRFSDHLPKVTLEVSGNYADESSSVLIERMRALAANGKNPNFPFIIFEILIILKVIHPLKKGELYELDWYFGPFRVIEHLEKDVHAFMVDIPVIDIVDESGEATDLSCVTLGYAPSDDLCADFGDHVAFFSDFAFTAALETAVLMTESNNMITRFTEEIPYHIIRGASKDFFLSDF